MKLTPNSKCFFFYFQTAQKLIEFNTGLQKNIYVIYNKLELQLFLNSKKYFITNNFYIFYEHTDKYMQYEKNCPQKKQYNQYESICKSIGSEYAGQENIVSTICLRFHCLMNNIFNSKSSQYDQNELAHLEYLNYWLNHELHLKNASICPKFFYQTMISMDRSNFILRKLRTNNSYIVKEEVRNMHALYHIYKNYVEMNEIVKNNTLIGNAFFSYANNIVEKYSELSKKCAQKNNFLCDALNVFKEKYNKIELKGEILSYWEKKTLPALVESGHSQEEITESSTRNREVSQTSIYRNVYVFRGTCNIHITFKL
ncbi:hypothetical protein PVIIG_06355 [Plasmodium vivax India VII]|uniref:CYIR protein n=1 Tax=Plasmodium vivax India VII TaxID=1077284 RepID=A0A0J9S4L2_PLAVI|nr:hypothetical protein PVIIG_06355 [Plasmodium vivax India VII]